MAIALSDYCRRASSPTVPAEVREALAHLEPSEDFRVRALADSEPEASPLGPFAAVDILFGASPSLAAQREACGYYELARLLSAQPEPDAPAMSDPLPIPSEGGLKDGAEGSADPDAGDPPSDSALHGEPRPPAASTPALRAAAPGERGSVSERIAPKKRARLPEAAPVEPELAGGASFARESARARPQPRGRFIRLDVQRRPASELFSAEAKSMLATAIEQHAHRFAITQVLSEQYATRGREALSVEELESALTHHALFDQLVAQERKLVLGGFTEHRGASGRVAWALGLRPDELSKLVERAGLRPEVESLRERFRRETLAPKRLAAQLDLLGRTRYLADLGIADAFRSALRRDLDALLEPFIGEVNGLDALVQRAADAQAAPAVRIARALEKLGLTESLERRIAAGSRPGEPSPP